MPPRAPGSFDFRFVPPPHPHPRCFVLFDGLIQNSEADPTSPGTDKDVDYYQHKSGHLDNFMPWRTGWESASDNKLVGTWIHA